ncbi:MAG TPA: glycosyltransferase family 4 protein [Terriglobales bacterium]|nr:glycosyltransferase family 4 protein [Terriglobales bacterium]
MKIAQVATADISIRYLLLDQIQALEEMGHEVTAVCAPGPHAEAVRAQGVAVEAVPMARELSPLQDLRSRRALARCFRARGFDVVHTHTPKAGLLGPAAARQARVPVVVHTVHGLLFHDRMSAWRRGLFWLPERYTARHADFLLSQSREDMEVAVRAHICSPEKIAYVGNGIEVGRFAPEGAAAARAQLRRELGLSDSDFVVGSVGRLVYEKGFAELFAAAAALAPAHPEIKFLIVGPRESEQRDAVPPERIRSLEQAGVVRFAGWQDDLRRWYSAMDLFALPSHREGIPRACMEAACMGVPVVASDIRGCREVVLHEQTGLLTPMRNAGALAEAIARLARDRALAAAMGEQGRRHILENFDARQMLARLRAFYQGLEPLVQLRKARK